MLNHFRVGECKAGLAILNGTATGYEVKSERDSLSRLERQVNAYVTVFAKVYVIAADDHIESVARVVPSCVDVLIRIAAIRFPLFRKPLTNQNVPLRQLSSTLFGPKKLDDLASARHRSSDRTQRHLRPPRHPSHGPRPACRTRPGTASVN